MAEKSRGNRAKEKEIQVLAKGLEEQHTSHIRMDHSKLAAKQLGNDQVGGGALDRLLQDTSDGTRLAATTTMSTSAMETTSDLETPGVSGQADYYHKPHCTGSDIMLIGDTLVAPLLSIRKMF